MHTGCCCCHVLVGVHVKVIVPLNCFEEACVCPQGAAAAMFPFEDEYDDLPWDEYGAALRPDEFQLKATSRAGQITTHLSVCIRIMKWLQQADSLTRHVQLTVPDA